ncbi:MAG: transcription antitermination factor NusB [Spirochaetia bacterium]|jgi:N utilization substance protein B
MGSRRKGRILAFQSLYRYDFSQEEISELCDFSWMGEDRIKKLQQDTLAFAHILISGTIENIGFIDEIIKNQLEHWDFERVSKVDLAILRMSIYCLIFESDIPASVTIDEAIDIAKQFGNEESFRFINGILDGVCKKHKPLKQ